MWVGVRKSVDDGSADSWRFYRWCCIITKKSKVLFLLL